MSNSPFSKRFGHDLSPEDVRLLFVGNKKLEDSFCIRNNTLVWGFRGTGKTMLLRYFDIEVQCGNYENFKECINESKFIGIHLNFVRGAFDMPNLDPELDKHLQRDDIPVLYDRMAYTLSEHFLISSILERMMRKFANCVHDSFDISLCKSLTENIAEIMGVSFVGNANNSKEVFEEFAHKIAFEKLKVANALSRFAMGNKNAFDPMQYYMTFEHTFKPTIEQLQRSFKKEIPVYLLLDDVNNLHTFQQKLINGWIGQRVHDLVCFKLASEPLEHRAFGTLFGTGRILQKVHDYDEIYLDFDDLFGDFGTRKKIYTDIANERIKKFFNDTYDGLLINELLPESKTQKEEMERIIVELNQKYPENPREVSREKWCELHKRNKRKYAGMDDLTILAFGNIREFLLNCDALFQEDAFNDINVNLVSAQKQHSHLRNLSKNFFKRISTLDTLYESIDEDDKLEKLITNLLEFFEYRLYHADLREKSFEAFTVKDISSLPIEAKKVLRRGIERQFFRKTYYSAKDGGRQDIFIVNKLLFPEYYLNIRESGCRIVLSHSTFLSMLKEMKVLKNMAVVHSTNQLTLEGLDMFDIEIDSQKEGDNYEYEFGKLY
jgi:hypothetical protein